MNSALFVQKKLGLSVTLVGLVWLVLRLGIGLEIRVRVSVSFLNVFIFNFSTF